MLLQNVIELLGCFVCGGTSTVNYRSYGDVRFVEF